MFKGCCFETGSMRIFLQMKEFEEKFKLFSNKKISSVKPNETLAHLRAGAELYSMAVELREMCENDNVSTSTVERISQRANEIFKDLGIVK